MNHPLALIMQSIRKFRLPVRWKIIFPFLVLGLWLVIGGSSIITQIVFENANERFNNQLMEGGKIAAEWMVKEEASQLEALRLITFTTGVADAIQANDAEKLRSLAYPIALNQQLEAVEVIDAQGRLIFSMRRQHDDPIESYQFMRDDSGNFLRYDFVRKVLSASVDQRGDKHAGLVPMERDSVFYIAGPIYDDQDRLVGALLVGTTSKTLQKHLREQTFARISLYRLNGIPLDGSFAIEAGLEPAQAADILDKQNLNSYTRSLRLLETDFVEMVNPWKARGQDLGLLGVSYSRPVFVNPSIPTRIGTFSFVFVVFVLIIVIGILIANSVTHPLVNLTRASREVSQGNLKIQVPSPVTNDELTDLTRTFNHMVSSLNQANAQILDAYDSTLAGWALALELRERETARHGQRVTEMTVRLAREMGYSGDDLVNIRRGALLHDIGKIGIPDAILNKPGPLTVEEFAVMKLHPVYAWEVISKIQYLAPALDIPYHHHEKWDGSGYPLGLAGQDIPMPARIFAVIDVWDAVTRDRVYRSAMTRCEALKIIRQGRGAHFDPQVVDVFLRILPELDPDATQADYPANQTGVEGIHVSQLT